MRNACKSCGRSENDDLELIEFADGFYCHRCNTEYEQYLEENRQEEREQDLYESYLLER